MLGLHSMEGEMQTIIKILLVVLAVTSAKDAYAEDADDKECPEAPPGYQVLNPGFRPVDGVEYCYLNDLLERGSAIAQWNLAVQFDDWGKHAVAYKLFFAAAEQGDALAQNIVGRHSQGEEAFKWYRLAAEQGNIYSQISLGQAYRYGRGTKQNYSEAIKLFQGAAENGSPTHIRIAAYSLGTMHDNGEGVQRDFAQARKWYLMAAEQGDVDAMLELSSMYKNGRGVPQDSITAYMWFSLYAANVYVEEPNSREVAEKDITPADISRAEKMAREWADAHPPMIGSDPRTRVE